MPLGCGVPHPGGDWGQPATYWLLLASGDVEYSLFHFVDPSSEVFDHPLDGVVLLRCSITPVGLRDRNEVRSVESSLKTVTTKAELVEPRIVTNRLEGAVKLIEAFRPNRAAQFCEPCLERVLAPREHLGPDESEKATWFEEVGHTINRDGRLHPVPGIEGCHQLDRLLPFVILEAADEDLSTIGQLCFCDRGHLDGGFDSSNDESSAHERNRGDSCPSSDLDRLCSHRESRDFYDVVEHLLWISRSIAVIFQSMCREPLRGLTGLLPQIRHIRQVSPRARSTAETSGPVVPVSGTRVVG